MDEFLNWFFGEYDETPREPYGPMNQDMPNRRRFDPDFNYGNRPDDFFPPGIRVPLGPPPEMTPSLSRDRNRQRRNINNCLFRFVFMIFRNGERSWVWPIQIRRRELIGFRWNGRRWVNFRVDLRNIADFICF